MGATCQVARASDVEFGERIQTQPVGEFSGMLDIPYREIRAFADLERTSIEMQPERPPGGGHPRKDRALYSIGRCIRSLVLR